MNKTLDCIEMEIFVAPDGDDGGPGDRAKPFRTLARARDAIRELKRTARLTGAVTVWLRGGRYPLAEPLLFTPEDSAPVTFAAWPGETPVIDGGEPLTGWQATTLNGKDAWVASVTGHFRSLFVNGRRALRPRLPKEGLYWIEDAPGVDPKDTFSKTKIQAFRARAGDFAQWRNLTDVEVVVLHFWIEERFPVADYDEATRLVGVRRRNALAFLDDVGDRFPKYYVENVGEALTEPGEWYLDRPAGLVYYLPLPGEDLAGTTFTVPRLTQLLTLKGDPDKGRHVEFLNFRGLTFAHTDWFQPGQDGDATGSYQAAQHIGGVIEMEGAQHCAFEDCRIAHTGWYAMDVKDGCTSLRIVGNELADLGAGGIKVNGADAHGPLCRRTGGLRITDNHLHDGGQVFHAGVGILTQHSGDNVIAHNHIHDFHYTGISVGWVWGWAENVSKNNRIVKNHIHDIGKGWLNDMGGIYTLGVQPGTIIRGNLIHDIRKCNYGGWAIYNDEGSSYMVVEKNVCYRTSSHAYHQHYGWENIIRNNIFAFCDDGQAGLSRATCCDKLSFTLERNILLSNGQPFFWGGYWGFFHLRNYRSDLNLLWDISGQPVTCREADGKYRTTGTFTLDQWRGFGYDTHSVIADPRCSDPLHGDFTLAPDSPALALGFEPIDLSDVGPRPAEKRDAEPGA